MYLLLWIGIVTKVLLQYVTRLWLLEICVALLVVSTHWVVQTKVLGVPVNTE